MTSLKNEIVFHAKQISQKNRQFLYAWVYTLHIWIGRLTQYVRVVSQINLLAIRQALAEMWFGRGLLHG